MKRTEFYCSSHTRLRQLSASRTGFYPSSHTRLRQLADFPSLILRSSFAEGSVRVRGKNSEKKLWQTLKVCQSVWRITPSLWCFAQFCDLLLQESTAAFGG